MMKNELDDLTKSKQKKEEALPADIERDFNLLLQQGAQQRQAGQYSKAQLTLQNAKTLVTPDFSFSHELCFVTKEIALVESDIGNFDLAIALYYSAAGQAHMINNPPLLADILLHNAVAHRETGKLKKAKDLASQALTIRQQELNANDPVLLYTIITRASILNAMAESVDAEKILQETLGHMLQLGLTHHPFTAIAYVYLGATFTSLKKFKHATTSFESAETIAKVKYGEAHRNMAIVYYNKSWSLYAEGQLAQAKIAIEKAYTIFVEDYQKECPKHYIGFYSQIILGHILLTQGAIQFAIKAFELALDLCSAKPPASTMLFSHTRIGNAPIIGDNTMTTEQRSNIVELLAKFYGRNQEAELSYYQLTTGA